MRLTSMTVGVGRTINLGNYESLRVDAAVTVSLEAGDDYEACHEAAVAEVNNLLDKQQELCVPE